MSNEAPRQPAKYQEHPEGDTSGSEDQIEWEAVVSVAHILLSIRYSGPLGRSTHPFDTDGISPCFGYRNQEPGVCLEASSVSERRRSWQPWL